MFQHLFVCAFLKRDELFDLLKKEDKCFSGREESLRRDRIILALDLYVPPAVISSL